MLLEKDDMVKSGHLALEKVLDGVSMSEIQKNTKVTHESDTIVRMVFKNWTYHGFDVGSQEGELKYQEESSVAEILGSIPWNTKFLEEGDGFRNGDPPTKIISWYIQEVKHL